MAERTPNSNTLYEQAACGLLLTDADGLILRANQTFCRWLGYEAEKLVEQRRIQDLLNIGGRIFHQTHWAPLLKMQGSVAEVKLEFLHRYGQAIPMIMNAVSDTDGPKIYHQIALFVANDRHKYERELLAARKRSEEILQSEISAQRELVLAEARFRIAVEAAELHVWDLDVKTGIRHFERSVFKLLGMVEPQVVTAEKYNQAIDPEDREREAESLTVAMHGNAAGHSVTYRLNGMDGVQRTILSAGRAVFGEGGELLQVIGVLQDVTEQARTNANAVDRALFAEQMIGIVSHDLRNPLSVILSSTDMLKRLALNTDQNRLVQRIQRAGGRSHRLIADLLDFTAARLGTGLNISRKAVDLHLMVAESIEELRHAFPNNRLEHRSVGEGLCEMDPDRMVQALGNLVANAVAYGDEGGRIAISSIINKTEFSLTVHNSGPPIPAGFMPNLFTPMTRGIGDHDQTKSVGLGLFIVQEIVRSHAGQISVTSSAAEGTTFFIVIPRAL